MILCPVCGFRNVSTNVRCLKCRALLQEDEGEIVAAVAAGEKERARLPLFRAEGFASGLRRKNPFRRFWDLPDHVRYRFPFTAGVLSLVPGLGQIYNAQRGKAVVLASAWWLGVLVCLLTLREPYSNILLLGLLLGWLLIWTDAIASAVRINREHWSFRNSVALWFAAMFATGVIVTLSQALGMHFISFVRVMDEVHAPDLRRGEMVLTNHMAYWYSDPELGEVIYFDPPRFTAERLDDLINDAISYNLKDYYQRLAGIGGDRIEKRDGRLWRNGKLVPPELEPFGAGRLPDGLKVEVPPGHYWLPVTGMAPDAVGAIMDAPMPTLHQPGWVFKGWDKAALVTRAELLGKAVAIVDPPRQRRWLTSGSGGGAK